MGILKVVVAWLDDRTGLPSYLREQALHPADPKSAWSYVFGSATLCCLLIQVVTGIALATAYVPSTEHAYDSLQFITHQAAFGRLVRGLHAWSASAMILLMGLHMIQVFLIAAYKYPREVNWLSGVMLFALTLGMAFTGQLIRWDSDGVWSVFIVAEQAGRVPIIGDWLASFIIAGETIGAATLTRFYAFHVFFLPALLFGFLGLHLVLAFYHGISEPPKIGRLVDPKTYRVWYHNHLQQTGVPFWPDAAWRDTVFGAGVIVVLFVLALILGPPELKGPPDPTNINVDPRPEWYFLWYFAFFALMPAGIEDYVIVLGPLIAGLVMILLPFISNRGERHPLRRPWAMAFVLMVVLMIGTLWRLGVQSPWSPDFAAKPLPVHVIAATSAPIARGGELFHTKGCQYCHAIDGLGGHRGPELTNIGNLLTEQELTIRIMNGGKIMPAFAGILETQDLTDLVAFLASRRGSCRLRGCGR
jgi:ubiquinol-cytochrome c reductase cytochrome b subunit